MKDSFDRHVYRYLLFGATIVLATGTVFYRTVENLSWLDAYYLSVITLVTVGYGDITPQTTAGKIFTTFYVFVGVGIITAFISFSMRRRSERFAKRRKKSK